MGSGYITGQSAKGEWYTVSCSYTGLKDEKANALQRLNQPSFAAPREAFGPVWTALYLGLGYVSHLSVKAFDAAVTPQGTAQADQAIQLYYAQLALNCLWTPLFFGGESLI
jgi:benzodiazapine receptor